MELKYGSKGKDIGDMATREAQIDFLTGKLERAEKLTVDLKADLALVKKDWVAELEAQLEEARKI